MKVMLESTQQIVWIESNGRTVPGRIWEGKTENGVYVQAVITRIAAPYEADQAQFQRELTECAAPTRTDVFPLRMVI